MDKQVYVYWLAGTSEDLQNQATTCLGKSLQYWIADTAELQLGQGLPSSWHDQGALFNEQGELRWWKNAGSYEALLLTGHSIADLEPLPGNWRGHEEIVFLQDLNEPRVQPQFTAYPNGNPAGRLKVCIYYHNGIATFVSPRLFLDEGEETNGPT
jgi:hypothetical protein